MPEPGAVLRWRFGEPIGPLRAHLAAGGVLAIPTESSYGLAADPRGIAGVEQIYEIKGRPAGKALPVVVADLDQARALGARLEPWQVDHLSGWWPAPLTAVLPLDAPLPASGGERTLAIRIPAHAGLRTLLRDLGFGLTATSANRSGEPPIVKVGELEELLAGRPAILVDGGDLPGGPPSTLISWMRGELEILRQGAFALEDPSAPERTR